MGLMSVISTAQATTEPPPDPRPGPTGMALPFANLMKSQTMRKYPVNPIWAMTFSSASRRLEYSAPSKRSPLAFIAPRRLSRPSRASRARCSSMVSPVGTGKSGSSSLPSAISRLQRSATASVFSTASGNVGSAARISASVRKWIESFFE